MTCQKKVIHTFLLDGTPFGGAKYSMANWTGLIFKFPRLQLKLFEKTWERYRTGVYILVGTNINGEETVYVG